jgi:ribose transport system substrate-binding protein
MNSKFSKFLGVTLTLVLMVSVFIGCSNNNTSTANNQPTKKASSNAPAKSDPVEKKFTLGQIAHDRGIEWVNFGVKNFEYAAKEVGATAIIIDAQNNMEKVLAGMEDLIAKKVDAVSVYSFSPDLDKRVATMAKDAGIPIVFENAVPADDVDYDSVTSTSYSDIGIEVGKYISEVYPNSKLLFVMGQPGMNITEPYLEGLKQGIAEGNTGVELVESQPTNWTSEEAMNVTQNMIQSGKKFDVIFANNEQIAQGVIGALKDAGLHGNIPIVSTGGSTSGIEMIQNGDLTATLSAPVSMQGMWSVQKLMTLLNGGTVEKATELPIIAINKDNLNDVIPWEPGELVVKAIGGLDFK